MLDDSDPLIASIEEDTNMDYDSIEELPKNGRPRKDSIPFQDDDDQDDDYDDIDLDDLDDPEDGFDIDDDEDEY